MSNNLKISSLQNLLKANEGEIVKLPSFNGDIEFVARVKQPSLVKLISEGAFPNTLLPLAEAVFSGNEKKLEKEMQSKEGLDKVYKTMVILAKNTLLEPTYKELEEAGIELTDLQLSALMAYSQRGVEALKYFRTK